jgi:hypothetical protein
VRLLVLEVSPHKFHGIQSSPKIRNYTIKTVRARHDLKIVLVFVGDMAPANPFLNIGLES